MNGYFMNNYSRDALYAKSNLREKYESTNVIYDKNASLIKITPKNKINSAITLSTPISVRNSGHYVDYKLTINTPVKQINNSHYIDFKA